MKEELIQMIIDLVGNDYLYFDTELLVRPCMHGHGFYAWGVSVSPNRNIYVMDAEEHWYKVDGDTRIETDIIQSLYQRVSMLKARFFKNSNSTK